MYKVICQVRIHLHHSTKLLIRRGLHYPAPVATCAGRRTGDWGVIIKSSTVGFTFQCGAGRGSRTEALLLLLRCIPHPPRPQRPVICTNIFTMPPSSETAEFMGDAVLTVGNIDNGPTFLSSQVSE